jgi:hypothetical protein
MVDRLLRRASSARRLPVPSPSLYSDDSKDNGNPTWTALRKASDPGGMKLWQRLAGTSQQGDQALRHLLYLHRRAFEAECEGSYITADFFWQEAYAKLRRVWPRQGGWDAAAKQLVIGLDGSQLRTLVATEIFVDAHIAFANGRIQSESIAEDDRAFTHARHLCELLGLPQEPPLADFDSAVKPAIVAEIDILEAAGRRDEAIDRIRQVSLVRGVPLLGDRMTMLLFMRTLDRLSPDSTGMELSEAKLLQEGIDALKTLRDDNPQHLLIFDVLAQLYHRRCVCLANAGKLSEALVECEKSLAHAPGFQQAEKAMEQLVENMTALQCRMAAMEAELRSTPGHTLNAAGMQLQEDARRGFGPLGEFRQSGQDDRIRAARSSAAGFTLWKEITGPIAPARPDEAQAKALSTVVSDVYSTGPEDQQGLADAYAKAAAARGDLPPMDALSVARFIIRRRQQHAASGDTAADDASAANKSLSIVQADDDDDVIAIAKGKSTSPGRVPAAHWWLGSQDRATRVLAVAAVLCAIGVAGISAVDLPRRQARNEAVYQMRGAGGNSLAVLDGAERFLQMRGLLDNDPRRPEVLDAYAQAFTEWFVGVQQPESDPAQIRIAKYKQLTGAKGGRP